MTPDQHERLVASAITLTRSEVIATYPNAAQLLWPLLTHDENFLVSMSRHKKMSDAKAQHQKPTPAQQHQQDNEQKKSTPDLKPLARPKIFDPVEVGKTLGIIREPTDVFEIRALNAQLKGDRFTGTIYGYFELAAKCITELGRIQSAEGVYITLNPVNKALLARAANRLKHARKGDATTSDKDIVRRRWLLIDVDAERPAGISATDEEKEAATAKAGLIWAFLREQGWSDPIIADSGNGMHLLYEVDLPCDDGKLLERVLANLADRFDGDGAKLDRTVHNPARIVRLYGTLAAKGDHIDERPHRLSRVL